MKELPDFEWERLIEVIGKDHFIIIWPREGENSQGRMVMHQIAVSPTGVNRLPREILEPVPRLVRCGT